MKNREELQRRIYILENNIRLESGTAPYWKVYGWQQELAGLRAELSSIGSDPEAENIREEIEAFKKV